jgi:hypothetical protein
VGGKNVLTKKISDKIVLPLSKESLQMEALRACVCVEGGGGADGDGARQL